MSVDTTPSTFEYTRDWLVSSDTLIEGILLADANSLDGRRDQARLRIHREEKLDKPDEEEAGETAPDTPPPLDARPHVIIKLADDTRDLVGTGTFAGSGTLHVMIEALTPEEFRDSPDDDTETLSQKFKDRKAWAIDKCNVIRLELLATSGQGDEQGNPYLNARKVLVSLWPNDPDEYESTDNFMGWMYEVPWR